MSLPEILPGTADLLLIADHASAAVPPGIDLGIPLALLNDHIAVDIGTDALTRRRWPAMPAPSRRRVAPGLTECVGAGALVYRFTRRPRPRP